ncbi:E3 ubiquitin-protein ligase Os04g0590900-like [Prosopis cineraria]|uniref:E3 ubiquitin-protein ligase Os04g0590900-like n=1 Tax=Prosopis cineraria TaxID=364024 RepID=UPI00240FF9F6|nr:E3 ubiquitin-protein ligase Os04g0590900-like [Prosopis cineraria]
MASLGNPRSWVPYMNNKDCSQGFCSLYCPQWCYIVYPPPPPFELPEDNSSPNFSPLVIAVIGILASALLLVSYYTIISRYCGNPEFSDRQNHDPSNGELGHFHDPSLHEPWHASPNGLDEALIKTITVCKYKKEDGLVSVADCSVCLTEFKDDDSIRLLPKCSHAFHIPCIDTWLKSHSSCPLCRASIFAFNASALPVSDSVMENSTSQENQPGNENNEVVGLAVEEENEETLQRSTAPKPTLRALSDLGNLQGRHSVIEIKDEGYIEPFRRSVSMDHSFQSGNHVEEGSVNEAGPSKRSQGESSKSNNRRRVLQCVLSPIVMKRSFSSGRFSISRGRQGIIPI